MFEHWGSFLKGKPGGVMESVASKVDTGEGCFRRGVITLNSLVFGNGNCALATHTSSKRFDLVEINRGSIRGNVEARSSTTPARQLHKSNIQSRYIHLTETKYCEDTRPCAELEASQQQYSELCKQLQGAETTLHAILLGVGGTIYTALTLDQLKKPGIDPQRSTKLARKLHAHPVQ
eukprot:1142657-Pelagomonas_calceolata.AAC.8